MKDCAKVKELLVDYAYNESAREDRQFVESHIERCALCAEELEGIKKTASAASSMKAELPEHMWDMHLNGIMKRLNKPAKKVFAFNLKFGFNIRPLAAGFAGLLMIAAGTLAYFGYFNKSMPSDSRETEMAESLDMMQNMEIIERLEFYKTMTEKLCEKEPC